jgi:hypothetical protein
VKASRERVALTGCALVAFGLVGYAAYAVVTVPAARVGLAALLAAIPIAILVKRWRLRHAVRAFRQAHAPRDLLIAYTASPHWQEHIEQHWLTRWASRSVALNRSAPNWKQRPEAELWRLMAGHSEHTPVAIVVPPDRSPSIFRFYRAFRDSKHGKHAALLALERELESALLGDDREPPDESERKR